MGLNKQAQEFFVYSTLGIVPNELFNKNTDAYKKFIKDNTELKKLSNECFSFLESLDYQRYCMFMCAKNAYNDLCRTLTYDAKYKSSSKDKKSIKNKEKTINKVCVELANAIYCDGDIEYSTEKLFSVLYINDDEFKECIVDLSKLFENKKDFHFGQVQKWVNMTLKYLYLLGVLKDANGLHIPIDSYIMKALSAEGVMFPKQNGDMDKYSDNNSVKWSRLDKKQYDEIVNEYNMVELRDGPVVWEHFAWIEQSEREKRIIN